MLFQRQKLLLALLDALGGQVSNLDFQKLLFLYCQEVEGEPPFEFVPYKFGGFSFTSYAEKRRLIERGLLEGQERAWKLTPSGKVAASIAPSVRLRMDQFVGRHSSLRGDELVAMVYRRFPYYAIRSEMAERLLAGDAAARRTVEAARPTARRPGLSTIGYEGRTLENYLNSLIRNGVTLLCDVRRNPLSRKYGFSKRSLSSACGSLDIRYEHLPELGIASECRRNLQTAADYAALFMVYKRDTLAQQSEALAKIRRWIDSGELVALTCYERSPERCHRHCIAEALRGQPAWSFETWHL